MSSSSAVQLIGAWPSPFVLRARVALNLKGIEYEFLQESFGAKSELLLKSNPVHKKIPVLLHHGKPICESLIIVQYIDEVWADAGVAILPSDPYQRAIQRFWAAYVDDKLYPALAAFLRVANEEAKVAATEGAKAVLAVLEGGFVEVSQGKPFFGGERIGFADIAFGSFLGSVFAAEEMNGVVLLDDEKTPHLKALAERFRAHEAVKGVFPEIPKLVEFFGIIVAKIRAAAAGGH